MAEKNEITAEEFRRRAQVFRDQKLVNDIRLATVDGVLKDQARNLKRTEIAHVQMERILLEGYSASFEAVAQKFETIATQVETAGDVIDEFNEKYAEDFHAGDDADVEASSDS